MKPQEIAKRLRPIIEKAAMFLSDADALEGVELFPRWDGDGHEYNDGSDADYPQDKVQYDGLLYKCIQSHTSQSTWNPKDAASLWTRVDDPSVEWPEWIQPTGSTDAYRYRAKVSHNGKHWISDYENNTWEPGVFGWSEVA